MKKETNSNLTLKILSVLMAVILWSYVMGEVNPVISKSFKNIKVNVNKTELEERDLIVVDPIEPEINVVLEGKRNVINKVEISNIIAKVDLSNYDEGIESIPVTIEPIPDVSVKSIDSKEITFQIDKVIEDEINIEIDSIGELPKGFNQSEPKISPQTVNIRGARSLVESVARAVVTVDISNETEDINEEKTVELLDQKGNIVRGLTKDKNTVNISIAISQVKEVPIELDLYNLSEEDEKLSIVLKPNIIKITGKKDDLDAIETIKTKPIDGSTIYSGMVVALDIPENVHILTKEEIKLIRDPIAEETPVETASKTLLFKVADMNLIGLNENLIIDSESLLKTLELTIEGNSDTINVLDESDFDIQLDLTDLEEGDHIVTPLVPAKPGITLSKIDPKDITIRIIREE